MAVREVVKDRILGGSYHNTSGLRNVVFSSILSLYEFFENSLFPNDPDRIVYASPEFAFRRRLQTQKIDPSSSSLTINSLNFPFLSFSIQSGGIETGVERNSWKNFPLEVEGYMDWNLRKKVRLSPIKISFDTLYFTDRTLDMHYVITEAIWANSQETLIKPKIEIDGIEYENMGVFNYNYSYGDRYTETEWLEKNNIQAIRLDATLDTFLIKDHTSGFAIPQSVIFNFANKHGLEVGTYDQTLTGVIDHIEGEVTF